MESEVQNEGYMVGNRVTRFDTDPNAAIDTALGFLERIAEALEVIKETSEWHVGEAMRR